MKPVELPVLIGNVNSAESSKLTDFVGADESINPPIVIQNKKLAVFAHQNIKHTSTKAIEQKNTKDFL